MHNHTATPAAPTIALADMLAACRAVAETLDPINRARFPLAERDLQTAFLHDLHPEAAEWWEMFGPTIHDDVSAGNDTPSPLVWAVIAASIHAHRAMGAPLDVQHVTETAKLSITKLNRN